MALGDLSYWAVRQAAEEFDALGREAFLKKYGFGPARSYFVVYRRKRYDSKALAGAAHGYLAGQKPLGPSAFSGGELTVAKALRALKFTVVNEAEQRTRNPPWSRDELILALDMYMRHRPTIPGQTSKQMAELSSVLNTLGAATGGNTGDTFRNPNGVYMKLMNFRRFDPEVAASGKKGLLRGNKDEGVVWNTFAGDPARLALVADAIRSQVFSGKVSEAALSDDDDLMEAPEGRVLTRLHRTKERNRKLVESRKRKARKETGKLICEACDFDFEQRYGERGKGFIEAHHTKPVHTLPENGRTVRRQRR